MATADLSDLHPNQPMPFSQRAWTLNFHKGLAVSFIFVADKEEISQENSNPCDKWWMSSTKFTTQGNRELCESWNETWEQQGCVTWLAARGARADGRKSERKQRVHRKENKLSRDRKSTDTNQAAAPTWLAAEVRQMGKSCK